MEKRLV